MIYIDLTQLIRSINPLSKEVFYDGVARSIVEFALGTIDNNDVKYICVGKKGYIELDRDFVRMFSTTKVTLQFCQYIQFYKFYCSTSFVSVQAIIDRYRAKKIKIIFHTIKNYLRYIALKYIPTPQYNFVKMQDGDKIIFIDFIMLLHGEKYLNMIRLYANIHVILVVHDIIPMLYPHFTSDNFRNAMQSLFDKFHNKIDLYLTNSKHTEADLQHFLVNSYGISNFKTKVIKWGFSITEHNQIEHETPLIAGNYIMYVSTFGARKNHIGLLKAWDGVIKSGKADGWKLICVGQKDKHYTPMLEQYMQKHVSQGVELMHNVGSDAIINLYKNCKFTVYPSLYEGYGMPIAESVYHGKLCIASNTSSMPEVVGQYADYTNPENTDDIRDKILYYITNNDALLKRKEDIKNAHIVTWPEASQYMIDAVRSFS